MKSDLERRWFVARRIVIVFIALIVVGGLALQARAAYPSGPQQSDASDVAPQGQDTASNDPFGIAGFDCADIPRYNIDRQMNVRAGAILEKCGYTNRSAPSVSNNGSGSASGSSSGSTGIAAIDKLTQPLVYGGTDVNIILPDSTYPSVTQSETFIWGQGNTVVMTNNDSRNAGSNVCYGSGSYSLDGGTNWTRIGGSGLSPFCSGHGSNYGDPTVVYDVAHAKWVVSFLATGCGGQGIGIWTSTNGTTWSPGSCAHSSSQDDRQSTWVDNNPASPYYGRMYISFANYNLSGPPISVIYSTNGGTSWSSPINLAIPSGASFIRNVQDTGSPGADGTVFVAGMDEGTGGLSARRNFIYRSTNGGVSFSSAIQIGSGTFPAPGQTTSGYFATMFSPAYWRHMGYGQPAVGPANTVHYVWAQHGAGSDYGDVYYSRSTNNGTSWSAPVKLNTDAGTTRQWQPSIAANASGQVFAGWYDGRNGTGCTKGASTPCYQRFGRLSTNGGASWQSDQAVSDVVTGLPTQGDPYVQTTYAGDYDYSTANGSTFYQTWVDGRVILSGNAQQDVYFDKIPASGGPTPTPAPSPTPCTPGVFSDVPPGSTFYPYVTCLASNGIIGGYSDCTFRPGNNVTRGQLSKIVSNSAGYSEPHSNQTFEDIPLSDPFYIFIERLASRGIISGYACGGVGEPCGPGNRPYFRPGNAVSRGQTSKIVAIAAGLPAPTPGQQTFEDVPTNNTFWSWIESLAAAGAISGYPCGGPGEPCGPGNRPYFRPVNSVTRGQSSKIVTLTFFPGCVVR